MSHASIRCPLGRTAAGAACLLLAASLTGCSFQSDSSSSDAGTPAKSSTASAADGPAVAAAPAGKATVKMGACDGGAAIVVSADLAGQALADSLLDQWKRNHAEANWVSEEKERHTLQPPADNADVLRGGQAKGDAYGNFTEREIATWARETEKFAAEGSRIFHDADKLGSTVAVSCDMCHPHAANTHPETYPKYQVQLGRTVLLRDMINWCVENPVRAAKLDPDGAKMRALEAYILAQRKGVPMNYGKH